MFRSGEGEELRVPQRVETPSVPAEKQTIPDKKTIDQKEGKQDETLERADETRADAIEGLAAAPREMIAAIENAPPRSVMFFGSFTEKPGSKQIVDTRREAHSYAGDLKSYFSREQTDQKPSNVLVLSAADLRERGVGELGQGALGVIRKICAEPENQGKKILAEVDPTVDVPENAWTILQKKFTSLSRYRGPEAETKLRELLDAKEPLSGEPALKDILDALPAGIHGWQQIRAKIGGRPIFDAATLDPLTLAMSVFAETKSLDSNALETFLGDTHRRSEAVEFIYFGAQEKTGAALGDRSKKLGTRIG